MDGFTGNVVLKASETLAESLMHLIREELERTPLRRLGAALSRGAFRAIKRRIDPSEYGGAPLLGVKGCCVIGHGRSNPTAIKHGIRMAAEFFDERREREHRGRAARAGGTRKEAARRVSVLRDGQAAPDGALAGKVSLVTGASRGIGRAIAKALAARGRHRGPRGARRGAPGGGGGGDRGRRAAGRAARPSTWPTATRWRRRFDAHARGGAAGSTTS